MMFRLRVGLALAALVTGLGFRAAAQSSQGVARAWGNYLHYDSASGSFTTWPMSAPAGLSNVVALVSGVRHVVALRADGSLVGWGEWEWGMTNVPPQLTNTAALAAGDYHTLALTKEGRVFAWGVDFQGQLKIPAPVTNAVVIGAGGFHSLAVTAWGQVYAWGRNRYGQCDVPPGLSNNVVALTGGLEHSVALLRDGRVVAWGDNSAGQTNVPGSVTNIIAIAARNNYNLALRADGVVLGWGSNPNNLTNIPGTVTRALAVAAGENHCLALLTNRTLVGWGNNASGQTTISPGTTNVFAIAAGSLHSAATLGPVPPAILSSPQDVTAFAGQSATFSVTALGAPGLSYQWRHAGTNLATATNATVMLPAAQLADAGLYDVVVTNLAGRATSSVALLQVIAPVSTAQFRLEDRSTLGNWKGAYGTQAYAVFGQATNFPSGAALAVSNAVFYPFSTDTTDPRALERANQPDPANRFSACVFSDTAMTFDVTLPLGATNQLAVYLMEPNGGRAEQVELIRPDTGAVLDSRQVADVSNGVYLLWDVTGPVRVRVARVLGANAVVSGLFVGSPQFKVPSLRYSPPGSTNLVGDHVVLSVGANGSPALAYKWRRLVLNNWVDLTSSANLIGVQQPVLEFRDFQVADAGDYSVRVSNFFGWTTSVVARLRVPGSVASASFVGEDRTTRGNWKGVYGTAGSLIFGLETNLPPALNVQVVAGNYYLFDSNTPAPNALERADSPQPTNRFLACIYADAELLLDAPLPLGATNRLAVYLLEPGGGRVEQVELLDTASGLPLDSRTVNGLTNSVYLVWDVSGPVQVRITRLSGGNAVASAVFLGTATGQAPLVRAQPASQTAPPGSAVNLAVGVNGAPALSYQWTRNHAPLADGAGRSGARQPVLQIASFQAADAGDYRVVVSNSIGATTSLVARVELASSGSSARFLLEDRTTAGNWRGVYGGNGYVVFGLATNLSFAASGASYYPFSTNTSDPRALECPGAVSPTNRFSACVFAGSVMTFDLPFAAGVTNVLGVYVMEPGGGRSELVEILDAGTGLVLDGRSVGSLATGAHLVWEVKGPVRVRVTRVAGANAVVSALFVGATAAQAPAITAAPAGQIAVPGGTVALGVSASGSPALGWQWRRNGQPLTDTASRVGTQRPVLNLTAIQSGDLGNYSVVVSNTFGNATSVVATVEFTPSNGSWITGLSRSPAGVTSLQLSGLPGQIYVVQVTTALAPANWINLSTNQAAADGSFSILDPAAVLPQRFYRTKLP
jgi:alpha-tubulin suppressor-like RCC1 family protein